MLYSRTARLASISLTAMILPEYLTNRTTWREIPRGSAARSGSGQSSRGVDHGRSSKAGSGLTAVISSATCLSWHALVDRVSRWPCHDTTEGGGVLGGHHHLLGMGADQSPMRRPVSELNRCTWPVFGMRCTTVPFSGGVRPSTRTMIGLMSPPASVVEP